MIKFATGFAAAFLTVASVYASNEAELIIPSAVEVSPRAHISVYDIVEAKGMDEDLASELKEIMIPEAAPASISKTELAKMLRTVKAHFVLPVELKILRSRSLISRMEVERKIKNRIYSNCQNCEIQVQISSVPSNMESDWSLDLNIDLSKSTLMVPVYATQAPDTKGWIVAEVKRYQSVPVLNRSVKIGDVLTEDMFSLEKRQLGNLRDTVLKPEALVGMQAQRFLNAGQMLTYNDVKKEQVLKRGQMVRAVVGDGSFEVAISAEAQEGGSIGEVVKIKNLDSQKVFAAKVIERGLVRIE